MAVNHLRGHALAAARRALQQDGRIVAAGLGDDGKGTLHGFAVADHGRFSTLLDLHRHEDFADRPLEIGQVERLEEILTRPKSAGLQGGVQGAVCGDDHHRWRCRQRLDFLQHFQPAHVRQADIENDERVGLRREFVDSPLPRSRHYGCGIETAHHRGERCGQGVFVFDDEDGGSHAASEGSVTMITAPPLGSFCKFMLPPCAEMMLETMFKPTPIPPSFSVKKSSVP